MKKLLFVASFIAVFFSACNDEAKTTSIKTGDILTLKSWDNQEIKIKREENGFSLVDSNKILIIDIFGTFCQPCRAEAPMLFDIQSKHLDDLVFVGLSYAEEADNEKLKEFAKNYNAYYFLTNDKRADLIVEAITDDIKYNTQVQLPFKVMLKDGKYQKLGNEYFILGKADEGLLRESINKAKENK
ncbi:TlpA family protein disulfide reductase [Campylobacter sp. RM12640]|uniref:TlpA family protein disulfide reductase n=1 Tax=unclassified Campylobacter TaxID=2593542 RepID=UPI001DA9D184|nr:TlpA disulfide reductase family protein [Campylobacter sp. RM12651]MBZ7981490.1 TlpA family protein disulfide reductase [Campylobacter sp. RM12640]MBZ7983592.1 TlpA family protein disulfide reductase [Campylobacter sp. RM12647]MBZ7989085.1 TlpA family protein disulfide reductase [Campylobacter sp. RM12635]MBZ7990577.1 TlpA family protein disulfide reductase [Campylobacter sp. RM9331]MBZ8004784.1 TlpA family protein disulfide reductase [Campylobacter sp. RM9332]